MRPIPILMYHKVGETVSSKADTFLNVSARDFERQMRLLKRLGYTAVTYSNAIQGLNSDALLPPKPVCITFDDGYVNVMEHAAPILKALKWPATVFVPTAYVGGSNDWDLTNGKPILPIMNWKQLLELSSRGWELAGHTHTHPHLDQLDDESASQEISRGTTEIEERTGRPVRTFCYPYGGFNQQTPGLVKQAGMIAACTTKSGLTSDQTNPFLQPRVKIAYRDGLLGFIYRLTLRNRF